ncbi:MAG: hypothetical protein EXS59_00920 [Candidatus Taylorbacteria bacterium]|nr:hypothetical protein [Candidatus Taylorbacteria bacterium]
MKKVLKFFDKLEDRTRQRLSVIPIVYAIIGGVAVVLFWRGVWDMADELEAFGGLWAMAFHPLVSLIISAFVLLVTGLFVSFFIGDRIILSGLKHEKKVEEKTESEVREEEDMIVSLNSKFDHFRKELEEIKSLLHK